MEKNTIIAIVLSTIVLITFMTLQTMVFPAPAPVAPAPASAPAGGQAISAPMPGTILKVNVSNGQAVKKGDVLFVLEAMKMENEIMAPCDGTVAGVSVSAGASVETGTALCSLA